MIRILERSTTASAGKNLSLQAADGSCRCGVRVSITGWETMDMLRTYPSQ